MNEILHGVVIGGAGGAIAGLTVYAIQYIHKRCADSIESRVIYKWLKENTSDTVGNRFRTTRAIASWNNVTLDRVRYLCSRHKKIYLSTGGKEDVWGVLIRSPNERKDEGVSAEVW